MKTEDAPLLCKVPARGPDGLPARSNAGALGWDLFVGRARGIMVVGWNCFRLRAQRGRV